MNHHNNIPEDTVLCELLTDNCDQQHQPCKHCAQEQRERGDP